jgi:dissimilatory sulfite reductase related protein
MPSFQYQDVTIEVDEDGFMEKPELWSERVAMALASTEQVNELTEAHWKVINYLRSYFQKGFSLKEIYDLFPSGPAKGACKVAGLAKPTGCV